MSTATITDRSVETNEATDCLTEALEQKLSHPATSPDFDLHAATSDVLKDIGLTTADVLSLPNQTPPTRRGARPSNRESGHR